MATHTILINDSTNKTKHLLGLIKEMAKSERNIEVDPAKNPYQETLEAIRAVENGNVFRAMDNRKETGKAEKYF
jgi:hypothetical protein